MKTKSVSKDRKTGNAHYRAAGLVPVACQVTPEVRELIRVAAARSGMSMAAFVAQIAEAAARKLA